MQSSLHTAATEIAAPRRTATRVAAGPSRRCSRPVARALELPQQHHADFDSNSDDAAPPAAAASRCPVLAALSAPPSVNIPWWRRFEQFTNPPRFQGEVLEGNDVVTIPASLGLPEMVMPARPEWIRAILAREPDLALPAPTFALGALLRARLEGAEHDEFRSTLGPAFTYDMVYRTLLPTIVAAAELCLQKAVAAEGPVRGIDMFKRLTFQVIMNVMMGKEYAEAEIDKLQALYTTFLGGMFKFPQVDLGPLNAYGRALGARKALLAIFEKDVAAGRAKLARGEEVPGQLGVMLAAMPQSPETDEKIMEFLLALLFAGHDTTSTALTSLFGTLPDHPDVMRKLREEQAELAARHGPGASRQLLKDMKYAEAVIRESMRYSPIASQLSRTAARDFELGGYKVKKGATLMLPLYSAARHDPRWEGEGGELAPGRFNPDRFLQPGAAKSECQMPFGHGGRYCLGAHLAYAELKVFMALFFQGYDAAIDNDSDWRYGIGRVPTNGLPMTVRKLPATA